MIAYLAEVLRYLRLRPLVGASDEHHLFDAAELPRSLEPKALSAHLTPLGPLWTDRLAETKTRAFRVIRDGVVTRSWDAPGDEASRAGRLYSVTKSVLSLAWGVADAEGRVPGLDEPVAQRALSRTGGAGQDQEQRLGGHGVSR